MQKKEEQEKDLLEELCADDAKLLAVLGRMLYFNPNAAISPKDLKLLLKEAETSIKDGNYEEAIRKYRVVVDKAIFEATQNPEERGKYIKIIEDLASKTIHVTEKVKEKAEKKGLTDNVASLEKKIEHYKFVYKRVDDIVNVAAHFYNERLVMLGDDKRLKARREMMRVMEREERQEVREEGERREARREVRRKMGREARREAEKEEKKIGEREGERREAKEEKIRGMEQEERQEAGRDKERRQTRRKKRRDARRKESE